MPDLIWFEWEKCPDGYTVEILEDKLLSSGDGEKTFSGPQPSERAPEWVHKLLQFPIFNLDEGYFVPKSDRVLRFRPLEGAEAVFMELSECWESDSNTLRFVENYGLPRVPSPWPKIEEHYAEFKPPAKFVADDWGFDSFQEIAGSLSDAVEIWNEAKRTGDFDELIHAFNTSDLFADDYEKGPPVGSMHVQLRRPTGGAGQPILSVIPADLESALWLQFAQAVSSSTQLQRCAVCPTWFVYGTGTDRRKSAHYCSDRCRKAAYRRRKATKRGG